MKMARPLKAIRLKCLDCCGWSQGEVKNCTSEACILHPLRFGKKPKNRAYSKISMDECINALNKWAKN